MLKRKGGVLLRCFGAEAQPWMFDGHEAAVRRRPAIFFRRRGTADLGRWR